MEYRRSGPEGVYYPPKSWGKYKDRDTITHPAEDNRIEHEPPDNSLSLIETFLTYHRDNLDPPAPLCNAALREFLTHATTLRHYLDPISHTIADDISHNSIREDIALLDDRRDEKGCASEGRRWNNGDYIGDDIFSKKLTVPELYRRLKENVRLEDPPKFLMDGV